MDNAKKAGLTDTKLLKHIRSDKYLILMVAPALIFFLVFSYYPMYGVIIAFKNYSISKGILGSVWADPFWKYFLQFFQGFYFLRLLKNTFLISFYSLLWGFPIPIIFALALNEFKDGAFKRAVQTISYMPHFISLVVVCGILINLLSPQDGIVNALIRSFGGETVNFLSDPGWFRTIYISSGIWQNFGWDAIIYLAALSGIDPGLYEAAKIDGAGKLKQVWYVSLPGIKSTVGILLLLSLGNLMNVGYEKIILLYNSSTYSTADVISTYVYRSGLLSQQYSFSSAVGLFNSVISIVLLVGCNSLSKRFADVSIW